MAMSSSSIAVRRGGEIAQFHAADAVGFALRSCAASWPLKFVGVPRVVAAGSHASWIELLVDDPIKRDRPPAVTRGRNERRGRIEILVR